MTDFDFWGPMKERSKPGEFIYVGVAVGLASGYIVADAMKN